MLLKEPKKECILSKDTDSKYWIYTKEVKKEIIQLRLTENQWIFTQELCAL